MCFWSTPTEHQLKLLLTISAKKELGKKVSIKNHYQKTPTQTKHWWSNGATSFGSGDLNCFFAFAFKAWHSHKEPKDPIHGLKLV